MSNFIKRVRTFMRLMPDAFILVTMNTGEKLKVRTFEEVVFLMLDDAREVLIRSGDKEVTVTDKGVEHMRGWYGIDEAESEESSMMEFLDTSEMSSVRFVSAIAILMHSRVTVTLADSTLRIIDASKVPDYEFEGVTWLYTEGSWGGRYYKVCADKENKHVYYYDNDCLKKFVATYQGKRVVCHCTKMGEDAYYETYLSSISTLLHSYVQEKSLTVFGKYCKQIDEAAYAEHEQSGNFTSLDFDFDTDTLTAIAPNGELSMVSRMSEQSADYLISKIPK